jgi:hypothetical protein
MASKADLIDFLERRVLIPNETHPRADETIKRKVRATRMRLNQQVSAAKVEQYFWNAMSTEAGKDSYTKISAIGSITFEDVVDEFTRLCGHTENESPSALRVRQVGTGTGICMIKLEGCQAAKIKAEIPHFYIGLSTDNVGVCPNCLRQQFESGAWIQP